MYYTQDLNLREIGVQLGVSESRVSQLISKSIAQLRQMLSPWRNDTDRSHLRAQ
ncbi:MAG: sigma factor-like helix-turn-helix DNA-binding protein [Hydrogenophaga sp.]